MDTRDRIVAAAAEVMRTHGLARATTREIARSAGYSEATLYKHFKDKTDLFLAVLGHDGHANLSPLLAGLADRVGNEPVGDVLHEVAIAATDLYERGFPIAASLFSEPKLLDAHRQALHSRGAGPHLVGRAVADYLAAEQHLGRVRNDIDPRAAAGLLLGACLERAFLGHFVAATERQPTVEAFATAVVETLLAGLTPPQP